MDFKKIINNVLGKTTADDQLKQAAQDAGKAVEGAVDGMQKKAGEVADATKKQVDAWGEDAQKAFQDLLAKTDLDEKAMAKVKEMLDKTQLDEEGMAMVEKAQKALNLPVVGDQIAKYMKTTKEELQAKIDAAKKAFNDVKNA